MSSPFCTIPEALEEIRAGRMVILMDDEDRENEGDLVCAAEKVTPEIVNFMLTRGRGLLCMTLTRKRCVALNLPPQATENTAAMGTAFTVSIDAHHKFGVSTGVSARDRCTTILTACREDATPEDFTRPGHIQPIMAREGGVLVRAGQTEGSVDLARLAGLKPAGAIIEIMNPDGTMARLPQLIEFGRKHDIKLCTIAQLIEYRLTREKLLTREASVTLPTKWGTFNLLYYLACTDPQPHLALCIGGPGDLDVQGNPIIHNEPVLVRVHSECLTGDTFGSLRCECGEQLRRAMELIAREGKGVVIYLRQEGRGIGLANKLRAYHLQETYGLDTVEANRELGFPADKRDYGIGAQILRDLGVQRIRVLTNNPKKVSRLKVYGLDVVEQIPLQIPPNPENEKYLRAKRDKMGHVLPDI
ncbi:MAG: bifunctional 3,4-dihydroxy-2-butanone-4-phosphate synthase/GTP cyclohydrolase II [Phycisphaerales bacterium]|nr:MAG: bifunctional 3,4-dihydroxy-2-butanone-4-phosphate synthase/GTP cyclohydrolase II [Phycisphaerales bacterium]